MLGFASSTRVFVCELPTDMRKSFDGLAGCVQQIVGRDPLSGHLFVFFNRRRTMVKMLLWDRTGFLVLSKRLESGTFCVGGQQRCREMDLAQLILVLEGIDVKHTTRRKRFRLAVA